MAIMAVTAMAEIQAVINRYVRLLDELNVLTGVEAIKKLSKEDFFELLIDAYMEGFVGVQYGLGASNKLNYKDAANITNKVYDGVSIGQKFDEYTAQKDYGHLKTLVESEYHRAYNIGGYDCAKQSKNDQNDIQKVWLTMLDDKVRDTHIYLDGVSAPIDGYFYTFDGDYARFPSDFQKAQNNANCRCIIQYKII